MGAYYQPHFMYGMGADTLFPPQPGDPNFMGPLQPADQTKLAANLVKAGITYPAPPSSISTLLSSKNLMILAVIGIAAYFLFFRKK